MGLYDSQLSDAKLNRIKLEGRIDELKQSIKITGQFLDNPVKQSPAFLQQQIETLKHEINTISDEVRQLRNAELIYGEPVEPTLNYKFVKGSIADRELVNSLFEQYKFDIVVNLAAQAGVRYSIENPDVYIESNIIGFYNILEACRHSKELATKNSELTTLNSPLTLNTQL